MLIVKSLNGTTIFDRDNEITDKNLIKARGCRELEKTVELYPNATKLMLSSDVIGTKCNTCTERPPYIAECVSKIGGFSYILNKYVKGGKKFE